MEEAMKRLMAVCTALLFANTASIALAQHQGLTKITDNVYSYVDVRNAGPGNSFGANAGIVIGKDGILVVDTLLTAKEARRFLADIRKVSDKPVRYVVDTHYHLDHAFGNSELAKAGGIVISQAADRKNLELKGEPVLKNMSAFGLSEEDVRGTEIRLPELTFTDRMSVYMGGEKIDLIHVGPSHTEGSLLVYLPERKLLFTGDILFTDFHPYMGEGDLAGWIKTLDFILSLDVDTIIPGHGPISGKKDINLMKEYLVIFDRKARELVLKSDNPDIIATELKNTLPARSQGDFLIPSNIREKYLQKTAPR